MLGRLQSYATRRLVQRTSSRLLHSSISWRAKSLRPFLLADIGEGITECEVLKWSVKPNAKVDLFDPLCEVQSDKASVEITSPFEGVVKELLVQEGDIAKVGQGLCIIEVEDSAAVEASPNVGEPVESSSTSGKEEVRTAEVTPESPSSTPSTPLAESSADVPAPAARVRRPHPLDPAHPPPPRSYSKHSSPAPRASLATGSDIEVPSFSRFSPAKNTLAMPSVRHFARKNSIDDLSILHPGSGKDGRIEMRDVEAHLAKKSQPQAPVASTSAAPAPQQNQEIELGRTRLAMFRAMTKSLEIPHLGYSTTLDLTALDALLPVLNAHIPSSLNPPPPSKFAPSISPNAVFSTPPPAPEPTDPSRHFAKLTLLPLLLKSLSRAMLEWPVFRTSINSPPPTVASSTSAPKPSLTLRPHADISVGLSTPTGLYSPTIQAVDKLNAYEIMGELRRLQHLGRQVPSGLTTKEMPRTGGTVTVSNIGAVGKGDWAHPLLVPGGGVAIVAIGRAKWVWKETEDKPGVQQRRLEVGVSWSADHRVIEGAEMAAFVESWRAWVEQPGRLVADGR